MSISAPWVGTMLRTKQQREHQTILQVSSLRSQSSMLVYRQASKKYRLQPEFPSTVQRNRGNRRNEGRQGRNEVEGPLSCSGVRNRRLTHVRKLTHRQRSGSSRLLRAHILIPTSLRAVECGCLSGHPAGVSTVLGTYCNVPEELVLH